MKIGVLALQGSFQEHCQCLARVGAEPVEVRKPEQLRDVRGLIIPGGESTTMALVAERWGLARVCGRHCIFCSRCGQLPALREFAASGRPIWGTCAGLIFLADRALGQKQGGQALIGGLDVVVSRNFFGSQGVSRATHDDDASADSRPLGTVDSFETLLAAPACLGSPEPFRAVFIRAPAVLSHGPEVEVLAEYEVPDGRVVSETGVARVAVAVRQKQLLGTAFHPELTSDTRWHSLFLSSAYPCSRRIFLTRSPALLQCVRRSHYFLQLLRKFPPQRSFRLPAHARYLYINHLAKYFSNFIVCSSAQSPIRVSQRGLKPSVMRPLRHTPAAYLLNTPATSLLAHMVIHQSTSHLVIQSMLNTMRLFFAVNP